jgi:DNA polymerase I
MADGITTVSNGLPWYLNELDPRAYLDTSRWLTADFETTNLEKGTALNRDNHMVLAAHKVATGPVVVSEYHRLLKEAVQHATVFCAQNAKFELQWMRRLGIDTDHLLVFDTMVAEYVLAGNRRWALDLDSIGRRYGLGGKDPVVDSLMRGGVCPSEIPRNRLRERVRSDVETTFGVAQKQLVELERLGLLPVAFTRCLATPVLAATEMVGMTLDPVRVREEYDKTMRELAEVERGLADFAAGTNLRSTKQLAELLYDKLKFEEIRDRRGDPIRNKPTKAQPEGARKTDADTLDKLKPKTAAQRKFLNLRKEWGVLNARITKSLEFFKHVCDERGGRFYAAFNQCVTKTHRLSSSGRRIVFSDGFEGGAQFQNLPNDLKRVFTASGPDRVLFEADGSGIEFRVAGQLGQDHQAREDIVGGADIHRYTASVINGIPEEEVTKEQRRLAKPDTFGPLFGKTSGTKGQVEYFEAFKKKYHQIATTQKGWVAEVLRTKELVTPWGMRFYWPNCKMRADGYIPDSTQIVNAPIQSFATADIVPIALVYIFWRIKACGLRATVVNTVHDSVIVDIHKDDVQEYTEIATTAFLDNVYEYLDRVYRYDFSHIPLGVGMSVATHWGDGEESKVSYGKDEARKSFN